MTKGVFWIGLATGLSLVPACAKPASDATIVGVAAEALGGEDRIKGIGTMRMSATGTHYNLGQDMRPGANGQTFSVASYARSWDVASSRSRTELTRTPNFAYFQGQMPQRQIQGLDGSVAYNINASGAATRVGAAATTDRQAEFYHHPLTFIRAALQPGVQVTNERTTGGERVADLQLADGRQLSIAFNAEGLPTRIESRAYHPNLGDVVASTHFMEYREHSGIRLPMRITTKVDDFVTAEITATSYAFDDVPAGDLAAPAAAASAAVPDAPAPNVEAQLVAPGVWLLAGQSHHSALIELSDRLLLVEAPQSEARTLATIAKARELQPAKPLHTLVMTHHHFDHTAGLRAAIAEGLTVIAHSGNRAFVEEMARRPHTMTADALARRPQPLTVETTDDERVISDATRTVAIYHVAGNPHSDTMLMVHLPAERVLIQVDAYGPGASINPYAANLLDNVRRRKLAVDRIVPLHGAVVPFADLVKAAAPPAS
jgi:glyoxylase-like metal-dependent hydrolase (beta-lactamase superfamily II)